MALPRMKLFALAAFSTAGLFLPTACVTQLDVLGAGGVGGEIASAEATSGPGAGGFGGMAPQPEGGPDAEGGADQVDAPFDPDVIESGLLFDAEFPSEQDAGG
jgi:hypothetical protein